MSRTVSCTRTISENLQFHKKGCYSDFSTCEYPVLGPSASTCSSTRKEATVTSRPRCTCTIRASINHRLSETEKCSAPPPTRTSLNRFIRIFNCCWKSTLVTRLLFEGQQTRWNFVTAWMMEFETEICCGILTLWPSSSNQRLSIYIAYQKQWSKKNIAWVIRISAGPSSRAVLGVGLRPLACWDYGFEYRRGHRRLSLVNVLCCQVDVSATDRFLVQRSPTDCIVCVCGLDNEVA